jgi:hypothetical protein
MAAIPTEVQVIDIRQNAGDIVAPFLVGYVDVCRAWAQASGDPALVTVMVLRKMIGVLSRGLFDCPHQMGDVGQRLEHTRQLLAAWELEAGQRGKLKGGAIVLNVNEVPDE